MRRYHIAFWVIFAVSLNFLFIPWEKWSDDPHAGIGIAYLWLLFSGLAGLIALPLAINTGLRWKERNLPQRILGFFPISILSTTIGLLFWVESSGGYDPNASASFDFELKFPLGTQIEEWEPGRIELFRGFITSATSFGLDIESADGVLIRRGSFLINREGTRVLVVRFRDHPDQAFRLDIPKIPVDSDWTDWLIPIEEIPGKEGAISQLLQGNQLTPGTFQRPRNPFKLRFRVIRKSP